MHFNENTHLFQGRSYRGTNVLQRVHRRDREISAFDSRTMALVATVKRFARGPGCLLRKDLVPGARHVHLPFHGVENKELGLGAEESRVA